MALLSPQGSSAPITEQSLRTGQHVVTYVSLIRHMPVFWQEEKFLLSGSNNESEKHEADLTNNTPVAHWKREVKLRLLVDHRSYDYETAPLDLPFRALNANGTHYRPLFYVDELHLLRKHMVPLSTNVSRPEPIVKIKFIPTSIGVYRLLHQLQAGVAQMQQMGFTENETDELLTLVSPDRLCRLVLTYVVSFLHGLFSFLAFKNEIGFWKGREDISGLSRRAVIGNAICSLIIFLFLYDSPGTSWLVLGTMLASVLIDSWKVTRVLKVSWKGKGFGLRFNDTSKSEDETNALDATGMRYLSMILYPLVAGWAVYSLFTRQHRSWYSWAISSAANGVYAFGFLMMTPQIFINYKLKSVAHLPWRAMTYKVFNTFVDDIFAWIIEMPTIHRLATLRDDLVFFVYLYQRWRYPVDLKRPNEFGYVYETDDDVQPGKRVKSE